MWSVQRCTRRACGEGLINTGNLCRRISSSSRYDPSGRREKRGRDAFLPHNLSWKATRRDLETAFFPCPWFLITSSLIKRQGQPIAEAKSLAEAKKKKAQLHVPLKLSALNRGHTRCNSTGQHLFFASRDRIKRLHGLKTFLQAEIGTGNGCVGGISANRDATLRVSIL